MANSGTSSGGRQFHLQQLVGQGAFGEVYLAEQDSGAGFRRKVAIKLLHADVAQMSRDAGRRMRDEARILGRLSHRNIVAVLDLVMLGDRWAIIMDYVPGSDLEEVLHALEAAEENFPGPAAIEVGAAVLNALDAAFRSDDGNGGELGVIHRDIKPSNVRLTTDGEVKVLDFGVARVNMDTREAQTRASGWIGTERYMSPERILCEGDGAEGDVYATAASVVELLLRRPLGRTPVREEKHSPWIEEALEECKVVLDGPDEVVDEVIDWLRRGLHALPEQRPAPMEMSDSLARLARQLKGESVLEFSRRFLGRVDELLERSPQPVNGTLVEGTSAPTGVGTQPATNPTLTPPHLVDSGNLTYNPDFDAADDDVSQDSGNRGAMLLGGGAALAAAVVVFVLVGGSLAAGAYLFGGTPDAEATENPEPVPVVVDAQPDPAPAPEPADDDEDEDAADDGEDATDGADGGEDSPEPAPVQPAPQPTATPSPPPAPEPEPAPVASGPPVSRALVVLKDASSLKVTCGGVSGVGTAQASIANFPSGTCKVDAVYLNQPYSTTVTIERKREVPCKVDGDKLTCT